MSIIPKLLETFIKDTVLDFYHQITLIGISRYNLHLNIHTELSTYAFYYKFKFRL